MKHHITGRVHPGVQVEGHTVVHVLYQVYVISKYVRIHTRCTKFEICTVYSQKLRCKRKRLADKQTHRFTDSTHDCIWS